MLFRTLTREELPRLVSRLAAANRVFAPVEAGRGHGGRPLYAFREVADFAAMRLDYTSTRMSAKRFFLPHREDLASFAVDGRRWHKSVDYGLREPFVLFGLHACDINALHKLDKVLLHSAYPMPSYGIRRRNAFIVGVDCQPQPFCFCRSMGASTALSGFDLFLTNLGSHYLVEIQSDTAFNLLQGVHTGEPEEQDHVRYLELAASRNRHFTAQVDTTDLTKILDMEFQSPVWEAWGERCLACGTCAAVCPTCYCYGVEESVALDLRHARKTKHLHSCNLIDFATVAGGHNFRPERHVRLKYRYYHKHRGFVEAYEESLCVGCGRCGQACLAEITVPEVIASVRGEGGAR
ncbi:MAG: 4Fe-4S dicluster domain-containing protein [Thermodesulfobacteriota bacterium]